MTDNEIIKALEYCSVLGNDRCDANCTMFYNGTATKSACMKKIHELSLDLINRQKAEIERLKDYNENLSTANVSLSCGLLDEIKRARAEAIKEFAERVESGFDRIETNRWMNGSAFKTRIDNLAKEMTEETTKSILNREVAT